MVPALRYLIFDRRVGDDLADLRARLGVQGRRGRFLQHLLVAALQRTVALAQMHDIALAVAQNLHFDMARLAEIFLDIDVVIAEGGLGLGAAERQLGPDFVRRIGHLHALAAAAGGAFMITG